MQTSFNKQIKILTKTDLRSRKIVFYIVTAVSLIVIVTANYILAPDAPSYPFLLKSKSEQSIIETLSWHISHNPSEVLPEDHFCGVTQSEDKSGRIVKLHCPSVSLSFSKKIDRPLVEIIRDIRNFGDMFWQPIPYENKNFQFSALAYSLDKVSIEKDTKGILGNELNIKATYKDAKLSEAIREILSALGATHESSKLKIDSEEILQTNLSRIITLRDNRYGYFLPIRTTF